MQEREGPQEPATPESSWISQDEEEGPNMQITMTTDELCAMARSQEKLNARIHWMVTAVAIVLAGGSPLQLVFHRSAMD